MRWFLNISTSGKLYASFGLMIVLLALIAAQAYRSVILIQASQRALYEQEFTDVLDIKDIRANQIANRADLLSLMVPGSRAEVATLETAISQRVKLNDEDIGRLLERHQADPQNLKKLQQFEALRRSSLQTRESQILPLIRAGDLEGARRLHLGVQAERDAQLDAIANDFVARTEQTARLALARSEQAARTALRVLLAIGFLGVLLAIALTMLLNRVLADPLKEISAAAERVAQGDLTVRLPGSSRADETGALMRTFARMIANLREMTRELSVEKQFLHNLMNNIPDSIFFKDREHRFLRINRAHAAVLGLARPEDVVGKATSDLFPLEDARRRDAEDREVMLSGVPLPDRVRRIGRPGGKLRWTSTTKAPVKDENGQVTGLVGIARDVTERVGLEEELREREAGLHRAQLMAKLAHVVTRPDGSFESWSATLPQLIGVNADGMPKSTREWLEILHPADRVRFREKSIEAATTGKRLDVEYRLRRADREWIDVRQTIEPMHGDPDEQGRLRWFSTLQDVTEQKQAEEKISRLNRVYAVLSRINGLIVRVRDRDELFREACRIAVEAGQFPLVWIGVVDRRDQRVKAVAWAGDERGFVQFVRPTMGATVPGKAGLSAKAIESREPAICNDIEADGSAMRYAKEALERGYRSAAALPLVVDGTAIGALVLYAGESGFFDKGELKLLLELAGDIAFALEHIQKAEKLDYLSYYDPLTGLANRSLFYERLAQHVNMAKREKHSFALCILDIERFKTINDTLGRQAGDALLRQIAERLSTNLDPSLVARTGADHFALLVPHATSEEHLVRSLEKGRERIEGQPYTVGGTELRLSTKAGVAVFPNDGADADSLFRNAEAALKKAKAIGERYLFYAQEMTERIHEKLSLENKLRQALEKDEFVLHYQPKIDLQTRSIVGVEALIRWQTPEGLVPPMKFIPLLEETGLILQAGSWALMRAALDHRRWVEQGFKALRVAVNVSPIQLRQRDFVGVVEQAIIEGIAPTGIDLEITESVVMQDIEANIQKLKAVCKLGVKIAIDDFGTGYSSLAYLAKLPAETLKIDRSFVIAMPKDPDAATLVKTMISLAHSLKLIVVAEGVDSEEQATILRLFGCDQMQGYLFSKPLPVGEMTALLNAKA